MRSSLFSLAPHAIGTSQAESLTSFIRRLAAAHVVSPSTLLVLRRVLAIAAVRVVAVELAAERFGTGLRRYFLLGW